MCSILLGLIPAPKELPPANGEEEVRIQDEKVLLQDIKNPEFISFFRVPIWHERESFHLIEIGSAFSFQKIQDPRNIRPISNIEEIKDYFIHIKDLKEVLEVIKLKSESIRRIL